MKRVLLLAAALAAALPRPAPAQTTRPWLEWRTVRTEHFDVHYPAELEAWARDAASRLETIRSAVGAVVGNVPARRVTVVIDDPAGETNGTAYSFLHTPYIQLYPTPADPRSQLGNSRGYTEQLAVHEFTHIAQLTRPRRARGGRNASSIDPRDLGPLVDAPRWVKEGYATYVEGLLTGSGRPHSAIRAAVVRQWALEGRLPAYGELDATGGRYQAGSMAYLVGSSFLEWLAARAGEESLVNVWRRMSAVQERTFDDAFRGVYGGSPAELYGLFTVEATANALETRRLLSAGGLSEGDTVQHLAWQTGDPAVSADGEHVAITLRGPSAAWSRVVVWKAAEEAADSAGDAARARLLARDPEDVPAVEVWPRAGTAVATLRPGEGDLAYTAPRFLPDGERLLVVRATARGGGVTRQDLFVWNWKRHTIFQVTHGAGIRAADPFPDGRRAAAVQCARGFCGLALVNLRTGAVTPLAAGTAERVFDRPRVSPDGGKVVAAMQEAGRWKIAAVDTSGTLRVLFDDPSASTYDPVFTADGRALVAVSEAGGVPNVVRIDLTTGAATPLTRVTGLAVGPEVDRAAGWVYYLTLHTGGLDLHRVHPDSASPAPTVPLPTSLAPAAPRVADYAPDSLARTPVPPSTPYGFGPRWTRVLPWGAATIDQGTLGVAIANTDPVGRLTVLGLGAFGRAGTERGASVAGVWRGMRPALAAEVAYVDHAPSRLAGYDDDRFDARYLAGTVSARNAWGLGRRSEAWRVGASAGRLDLEDGDAGERLLAFGRFAATRGRRRGTAYSSASLDVTGAVGRTTGETWRRGLATASLAAGWGTMGVRVEGTVAAVNSDAPEWERFTVGGTGPLLVDDAVLSQRVAMPALRWGALDGARLTTYRVSTTLGVVQPFLWGGTTDPERNEWLRMVGLEAVSVTPAIRASGIPWIHVTFGVAYGLNGAYENDLTAYTSLSYTP